MENIVEKWEEYQEFIEVQNVKVRKYNQKRWKQVEAENLERYHEFEDELVFYKEAQDKCSEKRKKRDKWIANYKKLPWYKRILKYGEYLKVLDTPVVFGRLYPRFPSYLRPFGLKDEVEPTIEGFLDWCVEEEKKPLLPRKEK